MADSDSLTSAAIEVARELSEQARESMRMSPIPVAAISPLTGLIFEMLKLSFAKGANWALNNSAGTSKEHTDG